MFELFFSYILLRKEVERKKPHFSNRMSIKGKINGIEEVKRDTDFDDSKYRNAGIRIYYKSMFSLLPDIKEGILLELGFDKTTPNVKKDISSWILDKADLYPSCLRFVFPIL